MLRKNIIIVSAILFFVVVNTSYFWNTALGPYSFPAFLLLLILFFVLLAILVFQIFAVSQEKFRILNIAVLLFVLTTAFLMPTGMMDFSRFEKESLLIAHREGAANCMTTFNLTVDDHFKETSVCFGTTEVTGRVIRHGDTLLFEDIHLGRHVSDYYKFAVIQKSQFESSKYSDDLVRYKNFGDTIGDPLWIFKNDMDKK